MNKNQADVEKMKLSLRRTEVIVGLVRQTVLCLTITGCFYILFWGLHPFIGQDKSVLDSFHKIIAALNFGNWISYLIAGILGIAWVFERKGKKRAISQKAKLIRQLEAGDPNRSSSGLTLTGETP